MKKLGWFFMVFAVFSATISVHSSSHLNEQFISQQYYLEGRAWYFSVDGNYFYLIVGGPDNQPGNLQLKIFDATDSSRLRLVSSVGIGDYGGEMVFHGNTLLVPRGHGNGFTRIDVSDKSRPVVLPVVSSFRESQYNLQVPLGRMMEAKISGNYLYVMGYLGLNSQGDGLMVFDISNFDDWALRGFYPARSFHVEVSGNHAFLCDTNNVEIIDVSSPTNPRKVSEIHLENASAYTSNCEIRGNTLLVGSGQPGFGFKTFDVTNKSAPRLLQHFSLAENFYSFNFDFRGNDLFVLQKRTSVGLTRIRKFNASNLASIQPVSTFYFFRSSHNVKVYDNKLFTIDSVYPLSRRFFEDTNVTAWQERGFLNRPPTDINDLQREIVAYSTLRLEVVVDDPDKDSITYSLEGSPQGMRVETDSVSSLHDTARITWVPDNNSVGRHNFVLRATDEFNNSVTVNISINVLQGTPPLPPAQTRPRIPDTLVANSIFVNGYPSTLIVGGNYLYLLSSRLDLASNDLVYTLQIFNVSELPEATLLSSITFRDERVHSMHMSGNFLYVSSNSGIKVIDVSDKLHPMVFARGSIFMSNIGLDEEFANESGQPVTRGSHVNIPISFRVRVKENTLYTIGYFGLNNKGWGLLVADISDFNHWSEGGFYSTNALEFDVSENGNTAAVCETTNVQLIDVRDANRIYLAARIDLNSASAYSTFCEFRGNYLFVSNATPGNGLKIYDVSDMSSPRLVYTYNVQHDGHSAYMAFDGHDLYLKETTPVYIESSILKFDISSPANPIKIARRKAPMQSSGKIAAANGHVFVLGQRELSRTTPDEEGRSYAEYDGNVFFIDGSSFVNRPPRLALGSENPIAASLNANTPWQKRVFLGDPDGDPINVQLVNGLQGINLAFQTIGYYMATLSWAPINSQAGLHDDIRVRLTDDFGAGYDVNFLLSISSPGNRNPRLLTRQLPKAVAAVPYSFTLTFDDPDVGDTLRMALEAGPDGFTVEPQTGTVSWYPDAVDVGVHDVNIILFDQAGGSLRQRFRIMVLSNPLIGSSCQPLVAECSFSELTNENNSGNITFNSSEEELCRVLNSEGPVRGFRNSIDEGAFSHRFDGSPLPPEETPALFSKPFVGAASINAHPSKLLISGNHAFVLGGALVTGGGDFSEARLLIFDVSDPYNPGLVSELPFTVQGSANTMALHENTIYVGTHRGIKVIDVTDKSRPVLRNEVGTSIIARDEFGLSIGLGMSFSVARKGNQVYSAGDWGYTNRGPGIIVIDVSNDQNWLEAGFYPLERNRIIGGLVLDSTRPLGVYCAGNIVDIIDFSNPSSLTKVSEISLDADPVNGVYCVLDNDKLFVSSHDPRGKGVVVYDLSNPTSPSLVGRYDNSDPEAPWTSYRMGLLGNHLYLVEWTGINRVSKIDVSSPQPRVIGRAKYPFLDLRDVKPINENFVAVLAKNPRQDAGDGNLLIFPSNVFENLPPSKTNYHFSRFFTGQSRNSLRYTYEPNGDSVNYEISTPAGLQPGASYRVVRNSAGYAIEVNWNGATGTNSVGLKEMRVREYDDLGSSKEFTWFIGVQQLGSVLEFAEEPDRRAVVGVPYTFNARVSNFFLSDRNQLRHVFISGPEGMTFNSSTLELSWTPTRSQIGEHTVELAALSMADGRYGTLTYRITVLDNPGLTQNCPEKVPARCNYSVLTGQNSTNNINLSVSEQGLCGVLSSENPVQNLSDSISSGAITFYFAPNLSTTLQDEQQVDANEPVAGKQSKRVERSTEFDATYFDSSGNLKGFEVLARLFKKYKTIAPFITQNERISIEVSGNRGTATFSARIENGLLVSFTNRTEENPAIVIKTRAKVLERIANSDEPIAEATKAIASGEVQWEKKGDIISVIASAIGGFFSNLSNLGKWFLYPGVEK